ncbi:uncharacterized protein LOC129593776 [Paramacrobiotus metropolitanus]|uniref:uncharacterized protein LOC129593776 n=1 Tax=Paramacrobiotus metropolitanus TaxID=2943436 RepID=UPI0024462CC7|nr:uncharacterized protein LOC129593776 [Paramacrobiotus metropolitanus]
MEDALDAFTVQRPLRPTLNRQGYCLTHLDPYCKEFIDLMRREAPVLPVADFGCGYGFMTLRLLETGCDVIANDLHEPHLVELHHEKATRFPEALRIIPGDCTQLTFASNSLGGILASRWIHWLTSAEAIRDILKKFYDWLTPDGVACITCGLCAPAATPAAYLEYLRKKEAAEEWPGWLSMSGGDIKEWITKLANAPDMYYGFDEDVLVREVELVGFSVEKCGLFGTAGVTPGSQLENSHVGVVARKVLTENARRII